jgi:hypothetical protein
MTGESISLKGATTHFLHSQGPRGFLLRFVLVYAVLTLVMQGVGVWTQAPVYELYLRAIAGNDGDITPYADELSAQSFRANVGSLILLPFSLALWVLFEAASQRRYLRAEGFSLKLGADEGRLALVGLIWFALLIAGCFALALGAVIPGVIVGLAVGAAAGALLGGGIFLIGLVVALYLFARLSPAAPLTIRDRQIRFFESWNLTRGHGWSMAGSYFALFAVCTLVSLVLYGVLFFLAFVLVAPAIESSAGDETANAVLSVMAQPAFWAPMAFVLLLVQMVFGAFAHALGGPAAWMVRQEAYQGATAITETFG